MGKIEKKTSIGRKASLSVVIGYNQSGSFNVFRFTNSTRLVNWLVSLSCWADAVLLWSNRRNVGRTLFNIHAAGCCPNVIYSEFWVRFYFDRVSILQLKVKKLGHPYSKCVGEKKNWLDYYPTYTEHQEWFTFFIINTRWVEISLINLQSALMNVLRRRFLASAVVFPNI